MSENKTIYLLKMGMDRPDGTNHRIRFQTKTQYLNNEFIDNIIIDFMQVTPFRVTALNGYIRGTECGGLVLDSTIYYKNNNCTRWQLPPELLKQLKKHNNYKHNNIIYSYDNILSIINYILKSNYDKIVLLEPRYIKNFNFKTFESNIFLLDKISYNNAAIIEEYARNKIVNELKPNNKHYDNTSYFFDNDNFKILVHYNCYNDIIIIKNIDNIEESKKQIDSIKRPDAEIKKAILSYGLKNTNKLY